MTNRLTEPVRVALTAAQATRLARLMAEATAVAAKRDEVLSALVESVTSQSMQGWNIQINEREIVLTPPMLPALIDNGATPEPVEVPAS